MIKLEGRGFKSHPGQSFPLSLCGPISICRANAHMVYGLKHQHFTSHSITTIQFVHRLIKHRIAFEPLGSGAILYEILIIVISCENDCMTHLFSIE